MFNGLLGEFGLLDIIVVLNYFENKKQSKQLKKNNKVALMIAMMQEQDQHQILEILKELKNERKN